MSSARSVAVDHRGRLRRHHEPSRVEAVGEDAGKEAEHAEREELAEDEDADRDRRPGQLEHEPRHRDVLHPRSRDRDRLADEEEPVVAMPEAGERAPVEAQEGGCHGRASMSVRSGSTASSIDAQRLVVERSQPGDEPRGAPRAHEPEDALRLVGQLDAHAPAVAAGAGGSPHEARAHESRDVPRHRRRRHAFSRRELPHADSRRAANGDEQRHLATRDAERVHLAAELAGELEQHGPQLVRDGERIGGDGRRGQFVNQVNKTGSRASRFATLPCTVVATITRPQKSLALILARGVAANLSVPISVLDADGNLVFFNEAAEEMHGMTFEEAGELSASEWPNLFVDSRSTRGAAGGRCPAGAAPGAHDR